MQTINHTAVFVTGEPGQPDQRFTFNTAPGLSGCELYTAAKRQFGAMPDRVIRDTTDEARD